jgi:hypothetical protein
MVSADCYRFTQPEASLMATEAVEKRAFARTPINSPVEYWIGDNETRYIGILDNLSATGALLWTGQPLPVGSHISLAIKSEEPEEPPIQLAAVVIRVNAEQRQALFGHGCQVEETVNA